MSPDPLMPLERLQSQPHGFSLFAALRLLERHFAQAPRLGESRRAADDAVRLRQTPHLSFAPSDVSKAGPTSNGRFSLEQYGFGVLGPNGALPLHLTELAYERGRQKEDPTIADFLNLFQHRLISLFYRAWADCEPAVSLDRPASDRFRAYVGSLIGLAPAAARDADAVHDYAKLSRAGLFAAQTRSAEGLEAILTDYFGVPVQVRQFVGAWLDIPGDLRCRLGDRAFASLGTTATLGRSTWQCQHKFEIVLGPLTRAAFTDFLPGASGLTELHSLVRLYTNDEWSWQARLLLRDADIPGMSLGQGQESARQQGQGVGHGSKLGWTSWLGARRSSAADVVIQDQRASAAAETSARSACASRPGQPEHSIGVRNHG